MNQRDVTIQVEGHTLLDLETVERPGVYRGKVKRGALVLVKGKRGLQRVVKRGGRPYDALYVIPAAESEPVRSRAGAKNWLEHSQLHNDHHQAFQSSVRNITHVAISSRRPRQRRW